MIARIECDRLIVIGAKWAAHNGTFDLTKEQSEHIQKLVDRDDMKEIEGFIEGFLVTDPYRWI